MSEKPRILVSGGTGYIGSHTVVELQKAGYRVVIIDNLSNSNIGVVDGIEKITGVRPEFVEGDCNDIEILRKLFRDYPGVKGIINFAASKAVGESVHKPILYYRNNLATLLNLLDLMPEFGVKGFVFSSSCTVYGEPDENPVTESTPVKKATSPYGNTKKISEDIITDVVASGAPIKSVILRYFNPVGAHPSAEIGELPLSDADRNRNPRRAESVRKRLRHPRRNLHPRLYRRCRPRQGPCYRNRADVIRQIRLEYRDFQPRNRPRSQRSRAHQCF